MCGFTGFIDNTLDKNTLDKMLERIAHRGPDQTDNFIGDGIALGFTRLSFQDVEHGGQPIFNEDQSLVILFNGEIYNFKKLRDELIEKGHVFTTKADTEVILHGYEEYGVQILEKLRGMFAFVIYDRNAKKLFGARDHFGIKPFYYYKKNNAFLFGSEIKSFLEHPNFDKKFNESVLSDYLSFGFNPNDETMFSDVYKLLPGTYFEFEDGGMRTTKYFTPEFKPDRNKSFDDFVKEIGEVMTDSVAYHNIADAEVQVGSFLSSGIDSSYIVKEASDMRRLKTFSLGYKDARYSELGHIKEFVNEVNVESFMKELEPEEYFEKVPTVQYHLDEPLADAAAVSLYFVSQEARKEVKAALSGEGADEFFAGYNPYRNLIFMNRYRKVPGFIRKGIAGVAGALPEVKGKSFLIRGGQEFEDRYFGCGGILIENDAQEKLFKDKSLVKKPSDTVKRILAGTNIPDEINRAQYLDINLWFPNDILLKGDKMSMAHSLEVRVPFTDIEVFKVASTVDPMKKVSTENTKTSLRRAAENKINSGTANKKKLGFPVPIRAWIREEKYYNMIKETFTNETANKYFNTEVLVQMLDNHRSEKQDNFKKIWLTYAFLVWHKEYFGN